MGLGHIVDEFHDEHSLAHTGTTKQPNLAATLVGSQQVHHLHGHPILFSFIESCISMQVLFASHSMPSHVWHLRTRIHAQDVRDQP